MGENNLFIIYIKTIWYYIFAYKQRSSEYSMKQKKEIEFVVRVCDVILVVEISS